MTQITQIDTSGTHGVDYSSQPPLPAPGAYNNGLPAPNGKDATDNGKSCVTYAENGADGHTGLPGIDGAKGGDGGNGSDFTLNVWELAGEWSVNTSGGNGGGGQTGGIGGGGQHGGNPGQSSKYCTCVGLLGGFGGRGGAGGAGGDGGKPGNAGNFYVTHRDGDPIFSKALLNGGIAGTGANGGPGGQGGIDGHPSPVYSGSILSYTRSYNTWQDGVRMVGPGGAHGKNAMPSFGEAGCFYLNRVLL